MVPASKFLPELFLDHIHLAFCALGFVFLLTHQYVIDHFTQPKQHRVFSKALLTDFHFPDELNFNKLFLDSLENYNVNGIEKSVTFHGAEYLVARAFRSDRTESILITATKNNINEESNECGMAFALALYNYMRTVNFMSRDIVFAFAESQIGLEASISALINPIDAENIPPVVIPSNFVAGFSVQIEGSQCNSIGSFKIVPDGNQLLPYMDMLSTVTKIASREGLKADFDFAIDFNSKLKFPSVFNAYIRSFIGHTSAPHSFILGSKIDAVTIVAKQENENEAEGIQELFRFFVISLRSFSNAIEHFQHESAVFVPLSGNDYLELTDVLLYGIILISPFVLMALSELFILFHSKESKKELFIGSANVFVQYLKASCIWAIICMALFKFACHSMHLSGMFVVAESALALTLSLIQPDSGYAFILSNVLLFVATLVCMFSSFGTGICLAAISLLAVSIFHLTRKLSFVLRLAAVPLCTFNFWFKAFLSITKHDTAANYVSLVSNNYFINLMIVPAILVLHIQLQKKD